MTILAPPPPSSPPHRENPSFAPGVAPSSSSPPHRPTANCRRHRRRRLARYVTVNAGALYSTAIDRIAEGDAILCNMTRTGPQSWSVSGALASAPSRATVQSATSARLATQPWAYSAVTECYGCRGCSTFPLTPIVFSENALFQDGEEIDVDAAAWKVHPPARGERHRGAVRRPPPPPRSVVASAVGSRMATA